MFRHWLITSTTYGTWLPGDERGSVSPVCTEQGSWVLHNVPDTPYDAGDPKRHQLARSRLKGDPVFLSSDHAKVVVNQFQETARFRNWELHAVAVMRNHFHVVASASEEVNSSAILRDLKSYAAGALNKSFGKPAGGTWWTESGSRRPLPDEQALHHAIAYVLERQPSPLSVWPDLASRRPERGREPPANDTWGVGPPA
jgi:REP element-mobilizing transposase RayT